MQIWDLENKIYKDILMGVELIHWLFIQTIRKRIETIQKGNMSSLNSMEEILLAERLIDLHEWADTGFTRTEVK